MINIWELALSPRSYPNEHYMCLCTTCNQYFLGHKRRTTCQECTQHATNGIQEPQEC